MNRNLALIVGLGAFGVLVVALLLRKGPTNFAFGDIGSKLILPSLGGGMSDAETKSAIGQTLKSIVPKPTPPPPAKQLPPGTDPLKAWDQYYAALASWNASNP